MGRLSEQVRQGAEHVWASVSEGWRELLTRVDGQWVASSDLSDLRVPSTIHALLAARLDGLPAAERTILTTAAVEGAVFHRSAVGEIRPSLNTALEDGLMALVSRDLIRPDTATFSGEKAFRFRHGLIRDAAYRSLPKNARADLSQQDRNDFRSLTALLVRTFKRTKP